MDVIKMKEYWLWSNRKSKWLNKLVAVQVSETRTCEESTKAGIKKIFERF
jgi:hypothetical protein